MESITNDHKYSVAAWIDQNVRDQTIGGFTPCEPEYIHEVTYDYIAIAIQDATVSQKVKNYLLEMGIKNSKIACMEPEAISQEFLEKCLSNINIRSL